MTIASEMQEMKEEVATNAPPSEGLFSQWLEKYSLSWFLMSPLTIIGLIIVFIFIFMMIFAPYIAPYKPEAWNWDQMKLPPSPEHLMGTDQNGGDIFSRIIWGSRLSLPVGFAVVFLAVIIGSSIGAIAGYYGGIIDEIVMRITDIFLSFPYLVLAMVFCAALGSSLEHVMLAMAITWWPNYARLVRGQALSIRENKYIEAAKALGADNKRIIFRHLLPNSISPIIVQATMDVGNAILVAASLSFIGFGARPGQAEWG